MRALAVSSAVVSVREARREQAARAVEQRQAVGELVVEVVAALGQHLAGVSVTSVEAAVDVGGGRRQSGVLQDVAVHL